jgi:hypothetical protein
MASTVQMVAPAASTVHEPMRSSNTGNDTTNDDIIYQSVVFNTVLQYSVGNDGMCSVVVGWGGYI